MSGRHPQLPLSEIAKANRQAQQDALFAGLTAGLAAAVIGSRLLGLGRNLTLLTGVATGTLSGYYFSRGFLSSRLSLLEEQQRMINSKKS